MAHFQIPKVAPTTCKSIRFPQDLVKQVEEVIEEKDCTFSAFVAAAVNYALEQLEKEPA